MLEGLDKIPWGSLVHAYGSAEDVPDKIRALASHDDEERRWAQEMLLMGILHQGSVYDSTAYAVKFLVELFQHEDTPDRSWLLTFLAHVARSAYGREAYLLGRGDQEIRWRVEMLRMSEADAMATIDDELTWLRMARDEVHSGLDTYLLALEEDNPAIRIAATSLLLNCLDYRQRITARLRLMLNIETEEEIQALIALGIGMTGNDAVDDQSLLVGLINSTGEPALVRMAAGFALIHLWGKNTTSAILDQFYGLLANHPEEMLKLHNLHHRYLVQMNYEWLPVCLHNLGVEQGERLIPILVKLYTEIEGTAFLMHTLLHLAFKDRSLLPTANANQLNELQRLVLEAIVERGMWMAKAGSGNIGFALEGVGIFDCERREWLIDFLEGRRPARSEDVMA
jgi:hypothetical protein